MQARTGFPRPHGDCIGHPVRPRLSSKASLPLPISPEDGPLMIGLAEAQWLCIRPFLHACPGIIYVGNETRGRVGLDGAVGCLLAPVTARVRKRELGLSPAWPTGANKASGRAGWLTCRPIRSCPRGLLDSTVGRARERGVRAPKNRGGIPPWGAAGAASAPRSTSWRINGDAPAPARDGRPGP